MDTSNDTTCTYTLPTGETVLLDVEDAELCCLRWRKHPMGYATHTTPRPEHKNVLMHRVILERVLQRPLIKGEQCDHANGNKNDNRRCNLRLATHSENQRNQRRNKANSTGFKGVYFDKRSRKWCAQIKVNRRHIYLGTFDTPEEAHHAYREAAVNHHGKFARFE